MAYMTMYTADGQPWQVPQSEEKAYLNKGYVRENPLAKKKTQEASIGMNSQEITASNPDLDPSGGVNINSDSIGKIAKLLPSIGTATARKIVEGRPYAKLEDLIAKVPLPEGQAWTALEERISF